MADIDRVLARYPHLADDGFVREHLDGGWGESCQSQLSAELSHSEPTQVL